MGTLLIDLSNGVDLERAVKSYENIMAPSNYKRPTALITKKQIEAAQKKVEELGLTDALSSPSCSCRRYFCKRRSVRKQRHSCTYERRYI